MEQAPSSAVLAKTKQKLAQREIACVRLFNFAKKQKGELEEAKKKAKEHEEQIAALLQKNRNLCKRLRDLGVRGSS